MRSATWFEARTCVAGSVKNMRGGGSTRMRLALAELCYRTLLADGAAALLGVSTASVTPALERLVEANTLLSGLGFESSGLATAHAVHNGLTAAPETHSYYHGEKVAFGLMVQLVLEGASQETFAEVLGFASAVNLPTTLAGIGLEGITRDRLAPIARRTTAPGETIHNEPFEVTPEMVADALLAADAIGATGRSVPRPNEANPPSSRNDFERLQVIDTIDVEVPIERENPREAESLRGHDEGGIGQVHRGVPVTLHEDLHPVEGGRIEVVERRCAVPDVSPEEPLQRPATEPTGQVLRRRGRFTQMVHTSPTRQRVNSGRDQRCTRWRVGLVWYTIRADLYC